MTKMPCRRGFQAIDRVYTQNWSAEDSNNRPIIVPWTLIPLEVLAHVQREHLFHVNLLSSLQISFSSFANKLKEKSMLMQFVMILLAWKMVRTLTWGNHCRASASTKLMSLNMGKFMYIYLCISVPVRHARGDWHQNLTKMGLQILKHASSSPSHQEVLIASPQSQDCLQQCCALMSKVKDEW